MSSRENYHDFPCFSRIVDFWSASPSIYGRLTPPTVGHYALAVTINEDFAKKFKEGKYVAWDTELSTAIDLIKEDIESYKLVNEFNNADSMGEENTSNSFSYFTKDSLGISIGVAHAIGDHAEFEISYSDITENKIDENKIWEDFQN